MAGCGGDDGGGSDEKKGARDPGVQGAVEAQITRETDARVGLSSPSATDPGFASLTTAKCKPVSDGKLTCVVKGSTAEGDFRWEWEAAVSDSGAFSAKLTRAEPRRPIGG
jgi:hypothetical protein